MSLYKAINNTDNDQDLGIMIYTINPLITYLVSTNWGSLWLLCDWITPRHYTAVDRHKHI